jgi:uncharacterized membrane protein YsdA (DUF1294 family)
MDNTILTCMTLWLLAANIIAYFIMWKDKLSARNNTWRVPEKYLFGIALAGGSLGIYLGTKGPLYHKASKPWFKIGIPVLVFVQCIFIGYLFYKIY